MGIPISFITWIIIILLFTINLVINISHLYTFLYTKFIINTSPIKSQAPRYESLYLTHCENNIYGINTQTNSRIYISFIIFAILSIIFFSNFISSFIYNIIKNKYQMKNEIKLLGYDKFFNKSIKSEKDYYVIYLLFIYIGVSFIYYGGVMSYESIGYNTTENDASYNIRSIDAIVEKNLKCDLYNILIDKDDYTPEINRLEKYITTENNINELTKTDKIEEINRILFTYTVSTELSFHHNNVKMALTKDKSDTCSEVSKCFFVSLSNFRNNDIFPDYDVLKCREVISKMVNYNTESINEIKENYEKIRNDVNKHSRNITKNKDYNMMYYKFHLLFVSLSAILISILAIIFFVFFECSSLNTLINSYYIDIDTYFSNKHLIFIKNYLCVIFGILGVSIIIL